MQDLYKIIIVLTGLLLGSWGVFGIIVNRWVHESDRNTRELFNRTNKIRNDIVEITAKCSERHK